MATLLKSITSKTTKILIPLDKENSGQFSFFSLISNYIGEAFSKKGNQTKHRMPPNITYKDRLMAITYKDRLMKNTLIEEPPTTSPYNKQQQLEKSSPIDSIDWKEVFIVQRFTPQDDWPTNRDAISQTMATRCTIYPFQDNKAVIQCYQKRPMTFVTQMIGHKLDFQIENFPTNSLTFTKDSMVTSYGGWISISKDVSLHREHMWGLR